MIILFDIGLILITCRHYVNHSRCLQNKYRYRNGCCYKLFGTSGSQDEEFGAYPVLFCMYATLQLLLSLFVTFTFIFLTSVSVGTQDGTDFSHNGLIPKILLFPFHSNFESHATFTYFEPIPKSSPFSVAHSVSLFTSFFRFDSYVQASIVWINALCLFCAYAMEGFLHWYRFYSLFLAHTYLRDFSLCKILRAYLCRYVLVQSILIAVTIWCGFYSLLLVLIAHAFLVIFCSNRHIQLLLQSSCEAFTAAQMKILMQPLFTTRTHAITSIIPSILFLVIFTVSNTFPDCMLYYPMFACLNTLLLSRMFVRNRQYACCGRNEPSPSGQHRDRASNATDSSPVNAAGGQEERQQASRTILCCLCIALCGEKQQPVDPADESAMELSAASPPPMQSDGETNAADDVDEQHLEIKVQPHPQPAGGDNHEHDDNDIGVDHEHDHHQFLNFNKVEHLVVAGAAPQDNREQTFVLHPWPESREPSGAFSVELEMSHSERVPSPKHMSRLQSFQSAYLNEEKFNNTETVIIPMSAQISAAPGADECPEVSHDQTAHDVPIPPLPRMETDESKQHPAHDDAIIDDHDVFDYTDMPALYKFTPSTHAQQTTDHHLQQQSPTLQPMRHTHSAQTSDPDPHHMHLPALHLHAQLGASSNSMPAGQHIKNVSMRQMDANIEPPPNTPVPPRLDTVELAESLYWLRMLTMQGLIQRPANMLRSHQRLQLREQRRSKLLKNHPQLTKEMGTV